MDKTGLVCSWPLPVGLRVNFTKSYKTLLNCNVRRWRRGNGTIFGQASRGTPLLAFDRDSTIFSDESDQAYVRGEMEEFTRFEESNAGTPLKGGPMARFFRALGAIHDAGPIDNPPIKMALVTSRNSHLMGRPRAMRNNRRK
jgi:hypothetical protein